MRKNGKFEEVTHKYGSLSGQNAVHDPGRANVLVDLPAIWLGQSRHSAATQSLWTTTPFAGIVPTHISNTPFGLIRNISLSPD